jgi:hypothetical protein
VVQKIDILTAFRNSPLVGAKLILKRPRLTGRKISLW